MRTLILIGTAFGLGAGLVCTALFAWWLSYPVHFYVGSYEPLGGEGATGHLESVDPIPFLAAGLILSAVGRSPRDVDTYFYAAVASVADRRSNSTGQIWPRLECLLLVL